MGLGCAFGWGRWTFGYGFGWGFGCEFSCSGWANKCQPDVNLCMNSKVEYSAAEVLIAELVVRLVAVDGRTNACRM